VPSPTLTPARAASLRERLVAWFRVEQRALPWRETRDPYRIWISEAMLQQTRVETVLGYYARFLERLPTLADLAAADEDTVLALWSGLGYYSRARKLREAARAILEQHGGEFPRTREEALALPGVGPYTAGAVLSIAHDLPEALVDGNVQRVLARLFGLEDEVGTTALSRAVWELAAALVPRRGAGEWNQALMELGATTCTARSPRCDACPVARGCAARESGREALLPRPKPRRPPTEVRVEVAVARRGGALLLEQRPPGGRMAGLWQLPTRELGAEGLFPPTWTADGGQELLALGAELGELRHSITRFRVVARVHEADTVGEPPDGWRWFGAEELEGAALTGMARKVLRLVGDADRRTP
jgi:A/G-specific adenine glycosylase